MEHQHQANSTDRRYFVNLDDQVPNKIACKGGEEDGYRNDALFIKSKLDGEKEKNSDKDEYHEKAISLETDNKCSVTLEGSKLLGRGRYSRVYLGRLSSNSKTGPNSRTIPVAIKICCNDQESIEHGLNEINLLQQLLPTTPNVIHLHDTITQPLGPLRLALILQYADGGNLSDKLLARELVEFSVIIEWIRDLFIALQGMHNRGLIHRDIKPHNLLIANGRLMIGDFGGAIRLCDQPSVLANGTLSYTAPELLSSAMTPASTASDVYSAGASLYTILTGRDPYSDINRSGVSLMIAIKHGFFSGEHNPWIPRYRAPAALDALRLIIDDCVRLDPDRRPTPFQILKKLDLMR